MTVVDPRARRAATTFLIVAGVILWLPTGRLLAGLPPGFLRDLGFQSGPEATPLAWALAALVAIGYATFSVRNVPLVREYWRRVSALKLLAIVIAFAAAIVEEAFFRRLVMDGVREAGAGALMQILASGLAFGLAHGVWGVATGRIVAGIGPAIATGLLGTALAVVYLVGQRSLAPPIAAHFVITAVIQPGIMFAAFSGQLHRPGRS